MTIFKLPLKILVLLMGTLVLVALMGTLAATQLRAHLLVPVAAGVIHSCIAEKGAQGGTVMIVDAAVPCEKGETPLDWNAIGPAGATGPAGADGATGATGATGPAGADGATGPTGATGPAGADGTNGTDGATGPAGADGTNGTDGATGPTGATGPAGADGTNGTDGATGPAGADGTNGTDGATGPAGADGTNGTDGADRTRSGLAPITFTAIAGGSGPITPISLLCSADEVATGLRTKAGTVSLLTPNMGGVAVRCAAMEFGAFGGVVLGATTITAFSKKSGAGAQVDLFCPASSVMTGIEGTTKFAAGSTLIENLSIQCHPIAPGPATVVGPAGTGSTTPFNLPCPDGVVTGIITQSSTAVSALLQIQARCQ